MVASSRRPETIDIRGKVADLGPVIDEADIMLLPSTHPEALGLVAIEAFAHGRAVVAFGLGGVLETVKDGAGWLVAPGDVGELAHTLGGLTRRDAVVAGGCARRRYEQSYSQAAFRAAMGAALAIGESDPRSAEHC
jgi:glycosyltransferase involved in cell wall biosynthesis